MLSSVLMFILGLGCIFVGLFLIIGNFPGVSFALRELLAACFFIIAIYFAFNFATDTFPRQSDNDRQRARRTESIDRIRKAKRARRRR